MLGPYYQVQNLGSDTLECFLSGIAIVLHKRSYEKKELVFL